MSSGKQIVDQVKTDSPAEFLNDTLQNLVANLGTSRDKTSHGTFIRGTDLSLQREMCDTIYRFQWLSKIVDIPPYDMTRQWRSWTSVDLESSKIDDIASEEKRLCYKSKIQEALTWGNLYGGCAIIISVDGHGDSSIPLDITKVTRGQLKNLHVVDRHRLYPQFHNIISDPFDQFNGEPELYILANSIQLIHRSRIVKFVGNKVPYWPRQRLLWWGDSVLNRLYDCFRNTETVISSIASMTHETNIDVLSIENLAGQLAAEGEEAIHKRFELMAVMKAINNMMLLDSTEKYERKAIEFRALPDIMKEFLSVLSAASDIPATRLLGISPGGLNATGESDLTNYYDMISGKQESDLERQMQHIDEVMIRSLFGKYPDSLKWAFNPLWQMSEKEQAATNLIKVQTVVHLQTLEVPYEAILKDVKELGLSNNLTDELIEEAISEVDEPGDSPEGDPETKEIIGENDDPNEPANQKTDSPTE